MPDLISANEIIEIASAEGQRITKSQLARWRRHGLLKTAKRRFPGSGSESYFLKSEVSRVIEIAALLEHKSSLEWVGWQLWLRGHPMPDKFWRRHVQKAFKGIAYVGEKAQSVTERSNAWWTKFVANVWSSKAAPIGFRSSRKAVGHSDFSGFLTTILQIAGGDYWGFSPHVSDEKERADIMTLDRGLGLRSAREHYLPGEKPWLEDDISPELRSLSEAIGQKGSLRFFSQLSVIEIELARDEFWCIRKTFLNKYEWQNRQFGDGNAFGLRLLAKTLRHDTIALDAALLAVWMTARTDEKLCANTGSWLESNAVLNDPAFLRTINQPQKLKRKTNVFPYQKA